MAACSGPPKKQSAVSNEGFDVPATCCCKTFPVTAEKELVPAYVMEPRMECSTKNGDCVDDVQCNGAGNGTGNGAQGQDDGVPPPPVITPAK